MLGSVDPLGLACIFNERLSLPGTAAGSLGAINRVRIPPHGSLSPAKIRVLIHAGITVGIPTHGVQTPAGVVIRADIGVKCVGLFGMLRHFLAEGARITGFLLGFLLQPRSLNLSLFGVSAGTARPGFLLTRVELHFLGLPAYFGGFFAVRFVPLLLHCPASTARHQEHDEQDHHNKANNNPNPGCNVQATHLFPFCSIGRRAAGLAGTGPADSVTRLKITCRGTYVLLVTMLTILRPAWLVLDQQPAFFGKRERR